MILEPQEELLLSFNFLLLLVHVSSSCSIALFFMLASSHDRGINHSVSTATPPHSMPRNSETIINPGGSHTTTSTASSKSKKSRTIVADCNHRTFATRKKKCRIEGRSFYKYSIIIMVLVAGVMATHVRAYSCANMVTKRRNTMTTRRRGGPITTSTNQDQTSSFIDDTNSSSSAILSDELAKTYQDPHQHGATDREPLLFTTTSSISSMQRRQKNSSSIAITDITQEQQQNWQGENNYQQERQDQQGGNNDEKQQLFLTVFGSVIFGLIAFFVLGYLLNYFRIRIRSRSRSRRAQIVRQQQDRGTAQSSTNEVGESVVSQQQMVNIVRSYMTSGINVPGTSNRSIIQPTMAGVQHQHQDTLQEQGNSINTNTSTSRSRDDIIGRNDFHDHQSQLSSSGGILAVNSIGPFVFPRGMLLQEEYDDNLSSDLETATAADEDLVSVSSMSSGRSCSSLNGEQRSNEAVLIS
jgi:Flp pilus assembly protein TadB